MGQFSVGEMVTCIPHLICRSAAPGDYQIVGEMPVRDGDRMYKIKSPLEEHERVVSESLLVKSEGCFPDRVADSGAEFRSAIDNAAYPEIALDEPDRWSLA